MSPYWQNNSCSPFTPPNASCVLGNMASYAINVSTAADVVAGLGFARKHNVRLTIKNTGHDSLGRSAGRGSLALWTHNLKNVSLHNYSSQHYTGPAIKLCAGVQAYEAYAAAASGGLRVTGGFCPTVGLAGGYVQGGGHGPLEGKYGLAADNTLEFEVVTGDGRHVVATPTQNADLFWALNGGGGGTYAVVLSQTTRAHPDGIVAGASLTFNNTDADAYWAAVGAWHALLLELDRVPGANTFWGVTADVFVLYSATLPDANATVLDALLGPFIRRLSELRLPHEYETANSATYHAHFSHYTPGLPFGSYPTNNLLGGRLVPRSLVQNKLPALLAAICSITTTNAGSPFRVNGIASDVSHSRTGTAPGANSVNPAWRESLYWLNVDVSVDPARLDEVHAFQARINGNQELLKALTPGGGAYVNEATFDNPTWARDYFGRNYARLLEIKDRYDPDGTFYGPASVGSHRWEVARDGRLCRRV